MGPTSQAGWGAGNAQDAALWTMAIALLVHQEHSSLMASRKKNSSIIYVFDLWYGAYNESICSHLTYSILSETRIGIKLGGNVRGEKEGIFSSYCHSSDLTLFFVLAYKKYVIKWVKW